MSDANTAGCLSVMMLIATITSWGASGVLAWNWIEPESFGGAIVFLFVWGIMGKVFDMILTFIVAGVIELFDK